MTFTNEISVVLKSPNVVRLILPKFMKFLVFTVVYLFLFRIIVKPITYFIILNYNHFANSSFSSLIMY